MSVQYKNLAFLGYPLYCVGDDGSLWSRHNNKWGDSGEWKRLTPKPNIKDGYILCTLSNSSGKIRIRLHCLVLLAFVGPCPEEMEGCHYPDRTRTNNKLTNLRWGTHSDNSQDARKHGTLVCGEDSNLAKLTEEQVREIRTRWVTKFWTSMWGFAQWVAPDYGVIPMNIYMIVKYPDKHWAHVKI